MKRTRAVFKLSLRYCRNHIDLLKSDACADSLKNKDPHKFWKSVNKISNYKSTNHVITIGGITGSQNIANLWKDHFQKLYSLPVTYHKQKFEEKLLVRSNYMLPFITMHNVSEALQQQKTGKAPGPDGLCMEAFLLGGQRLHLHLSLLFNCFLSHGILPELFCQSHIMPLVKSKTDDLTDVNNYRAITISTAVSKY